MAYFSTILVILPIIDRLVVSDWSIFLPSFFVCLFLFPITYLLVSRWSTIRSIVVSIRTFFSFLLSNFPLLNRVNNGRNRTLFCDQFSLSLSLSSIYPLLTPLFHIQPILLLYTAQLSTPFFSFSWSSLPIDWFHWINVIVYVIECTFCLSLPLNPFSPSTVVTVFLIEIPQVEWIVSLRFHRFIQFLHLSSSFVAFHVLGGRSNVILSLLFLPSIHLISLSLPPPPLLLFVSWSHSVSIPSIHISHPFPSLFHSCLIVFIEPLHIQSRRRHYSILLFPSPPLISHLLSHLHLHLHLHHFLLSMVDQKEGLLLLSLESIPLHLFVVFIPLQRVISFSWMIRLLQLWHPLQLLFNQHREGRKVQLQYGEYKWIMMNMRGFIWKRGQDCWGNWVNVQGKHEENEEGQGWLWQSKNRMMKMKRDTWRYEKDLI